MTNIEKLETILRHEFIQWQQASKEQLLQLMAENRRFFLETELEYGNEEYLDELLEEIDISATWEHAITG
jgi:recombinational DNA repair ATPase RecF